MSKHSAPPGIARVALDAPLPVLFDYSIPPGTVPPSPGARVRVSFGPRHLTAVVREICNSSELHDKQLKPLLDVIDQKSLVNQDMQSLIDWTARYYQYPLGQTWATVMPRFFRQARPPSEAEQFWRLTSSGHQALAEGQLERRAPRQHEILANLASGAAMALPTVAKPRLRRLLELGLIEAANREAGAVDPNDKPQLLAEQEQVIADIATSLGGFARHCLWGITGSGKTEVYLRIIEQLLAEGQQALIVVPEIGLTPQLCQRFRQRFPNHNTAVLNSSVSDGERWRIWNDCRRGDVDVLIGTRSASFTPMARLGVVIVDEEHDQSLKQQDGLRFHARDVLTYRASLEKCPIVLGSATPSLETLHNAARGRFNMHRLQARPGGQPPARLETVDMREVADWHGLAPQALQAMDNALARGEQVLVFLNRRGYAPVWLCGHCGWTGDCPNCDAHLSCHLHRQQLRCHHCGWRQPLPERCPSCHGAQMQAVGQGTEQLDRLLAERFSEVPVVRFDRDTISGKGQLEAQLGRINDDEPAILVGTQMLAKGHHWPRLTLAVIVSCDQLLFSTDFRAGERLAQLVTQIGGRSGRGEHPGRVLLQSYQAEHPLLLTLKESAYEGASELLLAERERAAMPPYHHAALLDVNAEVPAQAAEFARQALAVLPMQTDIEVLGPAPASMHRRARRHHFEVLLLSPQRSALHRCLWLWRQELARLRAPGQLQWSVDVDPLSIY